MPRPKKDPITPKARPHRVTKSRAIRKSVAINTIVPSSKLTTAEMLIKQAASSKIAMVDADLPEVDGVPPAWADDRAALASAIPWFGILQGGMYHRGGVCWGFLIDGDSGVRCHADDEIVITRLGGSSEKRSDGTLVQTSSQDEKNKFLKCVKNSMQCNIPVGMVIGSENKLLKRKLPYRFNIMDFFRVADIWNEKLNGKTAVRVRFEKLDLSQKSWWAEKGAPMPVPHAQRIAQHEVKQCPTCLIDSKQVYREGWICLNDKCHDFWRLGGLEPPTDLTFHEKFLEHRSHHDPDIQPHHSLIPDLLSTIDDDDPHITSSRIAWKGIVCPWCRKCIPRRFWEGWKCSDNIGADNLQGEQQRGCKFQKWLAMHPVSLRAVTDDIELSPIKRALLFDPDFLEPQIDDQSFYPYRLLTYKLGDDGYIKHFVSNRAINDRPGGPNALFSELQTVDLGLRRYPLDQAVVKGTLQSQFVVNYGLPYKYVVSVDSRGFSEACEPILRALGRLTWATKQAVQSEKESTLGPNELLVLGYLEGQKIGFHDDGESSLGPTVATLSLGSPATMHIRMKYKFYHGFTKGSKGKRLLAYDPVLRHCENYNERQNLKEQLLSGSITQGEYEKTWFDFYSKSKKDRVAPPNLIKMELNHGDMVVMHGENVQKYYEHGVELDKNGRMRFALTARHVKEGDVEQQDLPKGNFNLTGIQIYDGH